MKAHNVREKKNIIRVRILLKNTSVTVVATMFPNQEYYFDVFGL
jgi:hypothetical protein